MKRAVGDLANFADDRLFNELSKGIPFIVKNAVSLDETARRLDREKEYRASSVIQGFAEEEAAKALILIDLVRCPRGWKRRAKTTKRFYGHVAKRIYAKACSYPNVWSFEELRSLVQEECRFYYLDGPNSVDWILFNSITLEREQNLYVDYLQELADEPGDYFWSVPLDRPHSLWRHNTPDCVTLAQALLKAGAGSPDGLAEIANVWRDFRPKPETNRKELRGLIAYTLDQLKKCGSSNGEQSMASFVISNWTFPMWALTIEEPRGQRKKRKGDLQELREKRRRAIEWIQETDAKRCPPPAISTAKVEALSDAYLAWESVIYARNIEKTDGEIVFRVRTAADLENDCELQSYTRVEEMFRELTEDERAALLALGWYGRQSSVADWPKIYESAKESVSTLDDNYQIGLGIYWLSGLNRWKEKPKPFQAGQWYLPKRPEMSGR